MKPVFLDTAGMIANWDVNAESHLIARNVYTQMLAQTRPVLTTTFVMLECGNSASRRPHRSAVVRFQEQLEMAGLLIAPTDDDWRSAWQGYARGEAADAGIVDHVSFIVMHRHGITDAFTNDRHFKAAGFNTLF